MAVRVVGGEFMEAITVFVTPEQNRAIEWAVSRDPNHRSKGRTIHSFAAAALVELVAEHKAAIDAAA